MQQGEHPAGLSVCAHVGTPQEDVLFSDGGACGVGVGVGVNVGVGVGVGGSGFASIMGCG